MTQEAILYYADHPADFVEDLLNEEETQQEIVDMLK